MASVSVTIALSASSQTKCDVEVSRDNGGKTSWARFGWSIGGLALFADRGSWQYEHSKHTLYLLDTELNVVASAAEVPSDFLDAVVCGQSIKCDGEVWHVADYRPANWNFWYGCA